MTAIAEPTESTATATTRESIGLTAPDAEPGKQHETDATTLSADECARRIDVLRNQIDAVDDAIIRLIEERVALSKNVGRLRRAGGGPRLSLARENQIIAKFARALGSSGTPLAMLLLKISRGRM